MDRNLRRQSLRLVQIALIAFVAHAGACGQVTDTAYENPRVATGGTGGGKVIGVASGVGSTGQTGGIANSSDPLMTGGAGGGKVGNPFETGGTGGTQGSSGGQSGGPGLKLGMALREYWLGLPDGDPFVFRLQHMHSLTPPSGSDFLSSLQLRGFSGDTSLADWASNFGERVRGYIIPKTTGNYQFLVSGDQQVALYVSKDNRRDSVAATLAAEKATGIEGGSPIGTACTLTPEYTLVNSFTQPSQVSDPLFLVANQPYYFEFYHREGQGNTHGKVLWAKPGESTEDPSKLEVVPGSCLSSENLPPIF